MAERPDPSDEKRKPRSAERRDEAADTDEANGPLDGGWGGVGDLKRLGDEAPSGTFRIPRI